MSDDLVEGATIVGAGRRGWQASTLLALALLPAAWFARLLAFAMPGVVESVYSAGLYPLLARLPGTISGLVPFSVAELLAPLALAAILAVLVVVYRRATGSRWRRFGRVALAGWGIAGVIAWIFLVFWGFHYARPELARRLALDTSDIDSAEVLALGTELAAEANRLRAELGADLSLGDLTPLPLPLRLDFAALDAEIERALVALDLPGDRLGASPAPAKPLLSSELFSWLGISGIYIPFTAEPSVNAHAPDPSLPVIVAHEKAHQRGITDEGEANLVGLLATFASTDPYIRYAGHLDASARLIGAASRYLSEQERATAWSTLDPGPIADLRAISAYWRSYEGPAREAATRMNDAYLRSNRVPGGVQSYDRVTRLLVGVSRSGRLAPSEN